MICPKCKKDINADWMPVGNKGKKWLRIKLDEGSYGEFHNCADVKTPELGEKYEVIDKKLYNEKFGKCSVCNSWFSPKISYEVFASHEHSHLEFA